MGIIIKRCQKHGDFKHNVTLDKGGVSRTRCAQCANDAVTKRRRILKMLLIDEAGGSCIRCGYSQCPWALDFHHRDPSTKEFSISRKGWTSSLDKLRKEAAKCDLLCANCHREQEFEIHISRVSNNQEIHDSVKIEDIGSNPIARVDELKEYKIRQAQIAENKRSEPRERSTKIDWPSIDELKKMVSESSYLAVSRNLGVSDNAIRKRIRTREGMQAVKVDGL